MDDWSKYQRLADEGATPYEIYLRAKDDGVDHIACIRLLRQVFNLDLMQAKEVTIAARGIAKNLDDYAKNKLLPALESIFAIDDETAFYRQRYIDVFTAALNGQITTTEFDAALHVLWQETESHPDNAFHIAFSEEKEVISDVFNAKDLRRSIRRARKRLERIMW
jgi:hypothetical protein